MADDVARHIEVRQCEWAGMAMQGEQRWSPCLGHALGAGFWVQPCPGILHISKPWD